jgi:D-alanyl-D-alanine carboxypeptidase (penicillin-binding protein 5/6)
MKVILLILLFPLALMAALDVKTHAGVALLMNAKTGAILFEKNSNELCYPASITKIATALYAAKLQKDWTEIIEVPSEAIGSISSSAKKRSNYKKPAHWIEVGSTHIGLKKGERLSFHDLMAGMMVASANDAANVIAHHLSDGDMDAFMAGLNSYLKELGCTSTTFCNPHGLFMPKHQTTAADMALMARAYLKNSKLADLASSSSHTIEPTNKQERRILPTGNKLLRKGSHYYPKAIGLKTGYTSDSGHTLVAAAEHEGRLLIVVLMQCEERQDLFEDARALFDKAFGEKKVKRTVLKKGKKAVKKKPANLEVEALEDVALVFYPAEAPKISEKIVWKENLGPKILKAAEVATIEWFNEEGQLLGMSRLVAANDVSPSFWYDLGLDSSTVRYIGLFAGVGFLVISGIYLLRHKAARKLH